MTAAPSFALSPFGENGWLATFDAAIDDVATALFANAVADKLRSVKGVSDCVAGLNSVAVRWTPNRISPEAVRDRLVETIDRTPFESIPAPTEQIDIPVAYGGAYGPDFDYLRGLTNLSSDQLIEKHASNSYRVLMLGFAPGFVYLGPLDDALKAPRLDTPRQHVEAGSVGVAGAFSGVYSLASPGGWRIIGRTPKQLVDPQSASPFIFRPGAEIRFVPIDADKFVELSP